MPVGAILSILLLILVILVGLVAAGWGAANALRAPRPRSLGGAIVGALGLAVALLGATRLAVPGFF